MLKLTLIAMGNKMPDWIISGVETFSKRLQEQTSLTLLEIPLLKRGKPSDLSRILEKEMQLIRANIPQGARLIALDRTGEMLSSEQLATKLDRLQAHTPHLCLLIGGPEGLHESLLAESHERWSLSKLTLPHALARVFLLETLYRSLCILQNHPYHK